MKNNKFFMTDENTNPEIEVQAEQTNLEEVPEEVKTTIESNGNRQIDIAYKLSEDEVERLKESVPNNLQEPIVNSKIETGVAPQWWLVGLNNVAFALVAFVPGLNVMYAAVLYANLKILPMFPKKKLKNEITNNMRRIESKPTKKQPFGTGGDDEKQSFGIKDGNDTQQSFGTKPENNTQSFGTGGGNNTQQSFGIKHKNNTQSFGTGGGASAKQSFGMASHIEALRGVKTSHSTVPRKTSFGTYQDIEQNREKQRNSSFGLRSRG